MKRATHNPMGVFEVRASQDYRDDVALYGQKRADRIWGATDEDELFSDEEDIERNVELADGDVKAYIDEVENEETRHVRKTGFAGLQAHYGASGSKMPFTETEYEASKRNVMWNRVKGIAFGFTKTTDPRKLYARSQQQWPGIAEIVLPNGKPKYPILASIKKFLTGRESEFASYLYDNYPKLYKPGRHYELIAEQATITRPFWDPSNPNKVISIGNVAFRVYDIWKVNITNELNMQNNPKKTGRVHAPHAPCLEPTGYYGKGVPKPKHVNGATTPTFVTNVHTRKLTDKKQENHVIIEAKHKRRDEQASNQRRQSQIVIDNSKVTNTDAIKKIFKRPPTTGKAYSSDPAGDGPGYSHTGVASMYDLSVAALSYSMYIGKTSRDAWETYTENVNVPNVHNRDAFRSCMAAICLYEPLYVVRRVYGVTFLIVATMYGESYSVPYWHMCESYTNNFTSSHLINTLVTFGWTVFMDNDAAHGETTWPSELLVHQSPLVEAIKHSRHLANQAERMITDGVVPDMTQRTYHDPYTSDMLDHDVFALFIHSHPEPYIKAFVAFCALNGNNGSYTNTDDVPDEPGFRCNYATHLTPHYAPYTPSAGQIHSSFKGGKVEGARQRISVKKAKEAGKQDTKIRKCHGQVDTTGNCETCKENQRTPVHRCLGTPQGDILFKPDIVCQIHWCGECTVAKIFSPHEEKLAPSEDGFSDNPEYVPNDDAAHVGALDVITHNEIAHLSHADQRHALKIAARLHNERARADRDASSKLDGPTTVAPKPSVMQVRTAFDSMHEVARFNRKTYTEFAEDVLPESTVIKQDPLHTGAGTFFDLVDVYTESIEQDFTTPNPMPQRGNPSNVEDGWDNEETKSQEERLIGKGLHREMTTWQDIFENIVHTDPSIMDEHLTTEQKDEEVAALAESMGIPRTSVINMEYSRAKYVAGKIIEKAAPLKIHVPGDIIDIIHETFTNGGVWDDDSDATSVSSLTETAGEMPSVVCRTEVIPIEHVYEPVIHRYVVMNGKYGLTLCDNLKDKPRMVLWILNNEACTLYTPNLPLGDPEIVMPYVKLGTLGFMSHACDLLATSTQRNWADRDLTQSLIGQDVAPYEVREHIFFNGIKVSLATFNAQLSDMWNSRTDRELESTKYGLGGKVMQCTFYYVKPVMEECYIKAFSSEIDTGYVGFLLHSVKEIMDRFFGLPPGERAKAYPQELFLGTVHMTLTNAVNFKSKSAKKIKPAASTLARCGFIPITAHGEVLKHPNDNDGIHVKQGGGWTVTVYTDPGKPKYIPMNNVATEFLNCDSGYMYLKTKYLPNSNPPKWLPIRQGENFSYDGNRVKVETLWNCFDHAYNTKEFPRVCGFETRAEVQTKGDSSFLAGTIRICKTANEAARRNKQYENYLGAVYLMCGIVSRDGTEDVGNLNTRAVGLTTKYYGTHYHPSFKYHNLLEMYRHIIVAGDTPQIPEHSKRWHSAAHITRDSVESHFDTNIEKQHRPSLLVQVLARVAIARRWIPEEAVKHSAVYKAGMFADMFREALPAPAVSPSFKSHNRDYFIHQGGPKEQTRLNELEKFVHTSVGEKRNKIVTGQVKGGEWAKEKSDGTRTWRQYPRLVMSYTPSGFIHQNPVSMYMCKIAMGVNIELYTVVREMTHDDITAASLIDPEAYYDPYNITGVIQLGHGEQHVYTTFVRYTHIDPEVEKVLPSGFNRVGPHYTVPLQPDVPLGSVKACITLAATKQDELTRGVSVALEEAQSEHHTTTIMCFSDDTLVVAPDQAIEGDIENNDGSHGFATVMYSAASTPSFMRECCAVAYGASAWPLELRGHKNNRLDKEYNPKGRGVILGQHDFCCLFSGATTTSVMNSIINSTLGIAEHYHFPPSDLGFSVAVTARGRLEQCIFLSYTFYDPHLKGESIACELHPATFMRGFGSRTSGVFTATKGKTATEKDIVMSLWADICGFVATSRARWSRAFAESFWKLHVAKFYYLTNLVTSAPQYYVTPPPLNSYADDAIIDMVARSGASRSAVAQAYESMIVGIKSANSLAWDVYDCDFSDYACQSRYGYPYPDE